MERTITGVSKVGAMNGFLYAMRVTMSVRVRKKASRTYQRVLASRVQLGADSVEFGAGPSA